MTSTSTVRILRNIPYAEARIGYAGGAGALRRVTLAFDAYLPAPAPSRPAPALVMAFGGAFHRGRKEDDSFPAAGAYGPNTAVAEYCRRFAAEGFACFSVDYRLAPDDPDPGTTPVLGRPDAVPMSRIEEVRKIMGLPPATARQMADVMEAAIDDVATAARVVLDRANEFGVDPARLVLGGWSAGARCALYAAYADRVPCVGVLALSGTMMADDIARHVSPSRPQPALQLVVADGDVGYVRDGAGPMVEAMRDHGCDARVAWVAGRDHWYAAEAITDSGATVQTVLRDALRRWTGA